MVHCTDKTIEQKCTRRVQVARTSRVEDALPNKSTMLCKKVMPGCVSTGMVFPRLNVEVLNRDKFERPPLRDRFGVILLVARYMAAKTELMYSLSRE